MTFCEYLKLPREELDLDVRNGSKEQGNIILKRIFLSPINI